MPRPRGCCTEQRWPCPGPGDAPQSSGSYALVPGMPHGVAAAMPPSRDAPQSGGGHVPAPWTLHGVAAAMPQPCGPHTERQRACPVSADAARSCGGHAPAPGTPHGAAADMHRLAQGPMAAGLRRGFSQQPRRGAGVRASLQKKVRLIVRCALSDLHVVNFAGCRRVRLIVRCALWS